VPRIALRFPAARRHQAAFATPPVAAASSLPPLSMLRSTARSSTVRAPRIRRGHVAMFARFLPQAWRHGFARRACRESPSPSRHAGYFDFASCRLFITPSRERISSDTEAMLNGRRLARLLDSRRDYRSRPPPRFLRRVTFRVAD
jgi:hypothetical protein